MFVTVNVNTGDEMKKISEARNHKKPYPFDDPLSRAVCDLFDILQKDVHNTAKKHGFWDEGNFDFWKETLFKGQMEFDSVHLKLAYESGKNSPPPSIGEKIALIHSELSEGLEGARKDLMSNKIEGFTNLEEEFADAVIRMMDLCEKLNLDLIGAILSKSEYNKKRPYKHGKNF